MTKPKKDLVKSLEDKLKNKGKETFVLRLFVAGITPKSLRAIENVKKLMKEHEMAFDLEIIDIYQNPIIARDGQIIAAPTLVKDFPLPVRRFIGDMSNSEKLILGLDLTTKE